MKDPRRKHEILKGSFEEGVINKEELEKKEGEVAPQVEEFDKKNSDINKERDSSLDNSQSTDKPLLIAGMIIFVLVAGVIAFTLYNKPEPKTLEDLHALNLKGKLKPEQGFVYKGAYSFVTLDNQWFTQLTSPKGSKIYSLALRYSPRDLESIDIEGDLSDGIFNNQSDYYVTFNPTGKDFAYVALAVADFNTHMSKVFEKMPIAACDRNETEACSSRPIITCESSDKLTLYVVESPRPRVYYNDNCIVVEGQGLDLVKGVDRVLYNFYDIMEKEEN